MKTILLILVLSVTCFAQENLFKRFGDIKPPEGTNKMFAQLSGESSIVNGINESKLGKKPFSLQEIVSPADFNFDNKTESSQKFSFSKYEVNSKTAHKMAENVVSGLGKQNIVFPVTKKLSPATNMLKDEITKALSKE